MPTQEARERGELLREQREQSQRVDRGHLATMQLCEALPYLEAACRTLREREDLKCRDHGSLREALATGLDLLNQVSRHCEECESTGPFFPPTLTPHNLDAIVDEYFHVYNPIGMASPMMTDSVVTSTAPFELSGVRYFRLRHFLRWLHRTGYSRISQTDLPVFLLSEYYARKLLSIRTPTQLWQKVCWYKLP